MQQVTTKLAALWNNISAKELKEVKEEAAKCKAAYEMQKAAFPSALLKKLARAKNKPKGTIVVEAQGDAGASEDGVFDLLRRHREKIMRGIHADPDAKFTRGEMQQVTTQLAALWKNVGARSSPSARRRRRRSSTDTGCSRPTTDPRCTVPRRNRRAQRYEQAEEGTDRVPSLRRGLAQQA